MPLPRLSQLFHWGPILALSVIFYITVVCYNCILKWFPPWQDLPSTLHAAIYFFWLTAILYNFFMAAFLGPGFVEKQWRPKSMEERDKLQFCQICQGYKPPRSHHCRKCGKCVMKMDHHCPWINTCCGHFNHTRFIYFLFFCILGCSHASVVLISTLYRAFHMPFYLYRRHIPAYKDVPLVDLTITTFIFSVFALGLAIGVIISVSILLYIQMKAVIINQTGIEQWIVEKARHRHSHFGTEYIYPYGFGWRKNFYQVINWTGKPIGDGYSWTVLDGEDEFSLTIEQKAQKQLKRQHQTECEVVRRFGGSWFPITFGCCTCIRIPISDEPRMSLSVGELIMVTRYRKYWLYGTKQGRDPAITGIKGWFPRSCVVEVMRDELEQNEDEVEDRGEDLEGDKKKK